MAKPRLFISSTYYDLKYIRAGLEAFIDNMGYESILFEHGDIPFHFDELLEESCYKEVDNADVFVLIIGGRYGSMTKEDDEKMRSDPEPYFDKLKSVTAKEYGRAMEKEMPCFVFVDNSVLAEFSTFKENRTNEGIKYAHVDNSMIFELIDMIMGRKRNNFVRGFSTIEDITDWLRDQWAGLFAEYLRKSGTSKQLTNLQQQVKELSNVAGTLKRYNEAIIAAIGNAESQKIVNQEAILGEINMKKAFDKEEFIDFLKSDVVKNKNIDFWKIFQASSTLDNFIDSIPATIASREAFLKAHRRQAEEDFREFKMKYTVPPVTSGRRPSTGRTASRKAAARKATTRKRPLTRTKN